MKELGLNTSGMWDFTLKDPGQGEFRGGTVFQMFDPETEKPINPSAPQFLPEWTVHKFNEFGIKEDDFDLENQSAPLDPVIFINR